MAIDFPVYQPPDVSGAFQKGKDDAVRNAEAPLTLANMVDQEKLSRLTLAGAEKQQADQQKQAEILKGWDGTPEGLSKATSELTRAGLGTQAMDLMRFGQDYASGQYKQRVDQLDMQSRQHDIVANELDVATARLDTLKAAGADPTMLDTEAAKIVKEALPRLKQDHPDLAQQIDQWAKNPGLYTYAGVKRFEQMSNQGQTWFKNQLEQAKLGIQQQGQTTKAAAETEKERHDKAMEGLAAKRATAGADSSGALSDADARFAAEQYLAGDKGVFQGLGRGKQGAGNISKIRGAIRTLAAEQGLSAADVAAKQAEFQALVAEERKIGGIAGSVEYAAAGLDKTLPLAREQSKVVGRAGFTPFNSLLQLGEKKISDPDLRKFYSYTNTVLNDYNVLAARAGSDASSREHNREMLSTADSPEAYNAALDAIQQEINAAKSGGLDARRNVAAEVAGRATGTAGAASTSASPAKTGAAATTTPAPRPSGAPQGMSFASPAELQSAIAAGRVKKGDRVTVGGQSGTIQ